MDISTAKGFLDLAKGIFDPVKEFHAWRRERKNRVADLLDKISACLNGIAAGVESGTPIDNLCGELNAYMDSLMELLDGVVTKEVLQKYSQILNAATIQRKLIAELADASKRENAKKVIREAAGSFLGLANVLRV